MTQKTVWLFRWLLVVLSAQALQACGDTPTPPPDADTRDAPVDAQGSDAEPDAAQDDAVARDEGAPDVAVDVPAFDVPAFDVPAVDVPVLDVPTVDAPVIDVPVIDVPVVDVPTLDGSRPDAHALDVAAFDTPRVDAPVLDSPRVDVPTLDTPRVDVPAFDAPRVDVSDDVPRDTAASCDTGLSACGGACVDLRSNRNHCGTCGNACCPGAICLSGRCWQDCPPGISPCAPPGERCTTCVNLVTDTRNCGMCNRACADGQSCVSGVCRCRAVTEPPAPMGQCDGRGRIACQMWAQALAGGNPSAVATCTTTPSGCARADDCTDLRDPATCRCGTSAPCSVGQVCVLTGPTARCVCATP